MKQKKKHTHRHTKVGGGGVGVGDDGISKCRNHCVGDKDRLPPSPSPRVIVPLHIMRKADLGPKLHLKLLLGLFAQQRYSLLDRHQSSSRLHVGCT